MGWREKPVRRAQARHKAAGPNLVLPSSSLFIDAMVAAASTSLAFRLCGLTERPGTLMNLERSHIMTSSQLGGRSASPKWESHVPSLRIPSKSGMSQVFWLGR